MPYRVGVIGCGGISSHHAEPSDRRMDLLAGADPDPAKRGGSGQVVSQLRAGG
jgi:predicted dehydrogenase